LTLINAAFATFLSIPFRMTAGLVTKMSSPTSCTLDPSSSVCCTIWALPGMLPTIAPRTSSIRATEMPSRMLSRLASRASAIQAAAIQYTFTAVLVV
jgi:hypothetical protein